MSCLLVVLLQLSLKNTCMNVWAGLKDRQVDAAHTGISYSHSVPFLKNFTRSDVNTGRSRRKEAGNNSSFITSLKTLLTFSQPHAAFHVVAKCKIFLHFSFLKAELRLFQAFKTCLFVLNRNMSTGEMIMFVTFFSACVHDSPTWAEWRPPSWSGMQEEESRTAGTDSRNNQNQQSVNWTFTG